LEDIYFIRIFKGILSANSVPIVNLNKPWRQKPKDFGDDVSAKELYDLNCNPPDELVASVLDNARKAVPTFMFEESTQVFTLFVKRYHCLANYSSLVLFNTESANSRLDVKERALGYVFRELHVMNKASRMWAKNFRTVLHNSLGAVLRYYKADCLLVPDKTLYEFLGLGKSFRLVEYQAYATRSKDPVLDNIIGAHDGKMSLDSLNCRLLNLLEDDDFEFFIAEDILENERVFIVNNFNAEVMCFLNHRIFRHLDGRPIIPITLFNTDTGRTNLANREQKDERIDRLRKLRKEKERKYKDTPPKKVKKKRSKRRVTQRTPPLDVLTKPIS